MEEVNIKNLIKSILLALVSGVIGFYFKEYLKKFHMRNSRNALKKKLERTSIKFQENSDIFAIETGDPFFSFQDINLNDSNKSLFIEIPQEQLEILKKNDPNWQFRKQISFNNSKTFDDLAEITKISNLNELIEKHRKIVAQNFISIQEKNRLLFNGATIGLYRISRDRIFELEKSQFRIMTYKSDFFTQRVFASIYQELKLSKHRISKITKLEEFTNSEYNYSPFLCGVAATTFVVLYRGKSVVLAERSEFITSEQRKWHYSMDEGFTQTDYDEGKPSFVKCFYRGLEEELNIKSEIAASHSPKFMDLIFHRNVFELEFTSLFYYPRSFEEFKLNYHLAKDRHLETYGLHELELDKIAIEKFIKGKKVMGGCKLSLQLLAQRKNSGVLESLWLD